MMLRVVGAMAVAGAMFVAMGCDGGDKAVSDGQPDYAEIAAGLLSREPPLAADGKLELRGYGDRLEQFAADWRALDPPTSLRSFHDRYGDALAEVGAQLNYRGEPTPKSFDEALAPALRGVEARRVYLREFIDHYDLAAFLNEGTSMEPAYAANEELVMCRPGAQIERWQTVAFVHPYEGERTLIKRVVALPGEMIEIRDGAIIIDGAPIDGDEYGQEAPDYVVASLTVPEDRYYVLGDNRNNSFDSHVWGESDAGDGLADASTVPIGDIRGELPPGNAKICPTIAER